MSHDSRYEAKCPQHGWYFFEDGCAVAGCENAPAVDQSGAFPEQGRPGYELREVAQRLRLMDLCGAHTPRAHFVTLGRAASLLEDAARALERPRPAPPEPEIAKRLRHLAISGTVGGDLMIRAAALLEDSR